mgnify:FL=1
MILIKLLGGAKKSFDNDVIKIDAASMSILQLLDYLEKIKPINTLEFDKKNLLIAVNGADSSSLQGYDTILHSGDIVNIIPIIHGGSRIQFVLESQNVELFNIKGKKGKNYDHLIKIRNLFPKIIMEGISSKKIASVLHVKKILTKSFFAKKNNMLLAKKFETDILLRFAATTQILKAVKQVGIEETDKFTIIAIGSKYQLDRLYSYLQKNLINVNYNQNKSHILKQFNISNRYLQIVDSKNPLEDILGEKASVLFQ